MSRRYGICVGGEGGELLIHVSAKEKTLTRVPSGQVPSDVVSSGHSPAARFLAAERLTETRFGWNRELLRSKTAELCSDVRALRRLFDESLSLGWPEIVQWAPLSTSEKNWRIAHHAAQTRNTELLRASLAALPRVGYPDRALLLLAFLGEMRANPERWAGLVATAVEASANGAGGVQAAAFGHWEDAVTAAVSLLGSSRGVSWQVVIEAMKEGVNVPPAESSRSPAWSALSLISGSRGDVLDHQVGSLAGLDVAILDDLIDVGILTPAARLTALPAEKYRYLQARLDPSPLDDEAIAELGYIEELARRYVVRGDPRLFSLYGSPHVDHFKAVGAVAAGREFDANHLEASVRTLLDQAQAVRDDLRPTQAFRLPPDLSNDPTLWPMFSQHAIDGRLLADPAKPQDDPLNRWIGLNRLLGLIWDGATGDAVEHGRRLVEGISDERLNDEARSMLAYALLQSGRVDEALGVLEHALQGMYSENLLVNASIVAAEAGPTVGLSHLARLVAEAPSPALQLAALARALTIWRTSDLEFPRTLLGALQEALSRSMEVTDYAFLGESALLCAPDALTRARNPGGDLDGPHRLLKARARFRVEANYFLSDLAREFVAVHKAYGRPAWFNEQWLPMLEAIKESVFVDFGEAGGSAQFIDTVLIESPDLFTPHDRWLLAPQAGGHLATRFAKDDDSVLNDGAWNKFFFAPIEEFLAERHTLEQGEADFLAGNFTLCIGIAGMRYLGTRRDWVAKKYNPLVDRIRWDRENFARLRAEMYNALASSDDAFLLLDRVTERMRRLGSEKKERVELTTDLSRQIADWRNEVRQLRSDL